MDKKIAQSLKTVAAEKAVTAGDNVIGETLGTVVFCEKYVGI